MSNHSSFFTEYHTILFYFLQKKLDLEEFKIIREEPINNIINFYKTMFIHKSPMGKIEGLDFLDLLQNRLEQELKEFISQKGIYYWFHLYRRIGPIASINNESKQTVWFYRNIR